MHEAGDGKHIAEKYKNRGLRVFAVDRDGRAHEGSELKWRAAGASFPLYNRFYNSFENCYKNVKGYPSFICVKEWKAEKIIGYESEIRTIFGFN